MCNTQGRRIGIMGGPFDPIHHGHLSAAAEVQFALGLEEVIFIPAGDPVHKNHRQVSPAEDRYLMTVIATSSNPTFSVSRVDIDRNAPTYTVDTLTDVASLYPDAELFFITGADVLAEIFSWERSEGLFELASFVGCSRPGYHLSEQVLSQAPEGRLQLVEVPALAISSTEVRDRSRAGEPVWYLTPDGVVQYISKRGLYGGSHE